jgi:sugar phosphate permease
MITVTLIAAWFTRSRRGVAIGLLCWGLLHLVGGGILSVLPLPFLPFAPEQSVSHYLFHAIYAWAQIPLVLSAGGWLHSHRHTRQQHSSGMRRETRATYGEL